MRSRALDRVAVHAAAVLMTLLAVACIAAAVAVVALLDGVLAVPAAAVAAGVTFQALRVPVGRTASRLLDG